MPEIITQSFKVIVSKLVKSDVKRSVEDDLVSEEALVTIEEGISTILSDPTLVIEIETK